MNLTEENYHSVEARLEYMGSSQFKAFKKCEAAALAEVKGEYEPKKTPSLLVGSYVDAYYSGTLEQFKSENPEIFKKDGTLKSEYVKADEIIEFLNKDPVMTKYLTEGEHQKILTGTIAGVKFKIKIDNLREKSIIDLKVMADLDGSWIKKEGRNALVNFVEAYRYDIQGALYQEITRQNIIKRLPFVLATVTKEDPPRKGLFEIDQEDLDNALEEVKQLAPRYDAIKKGLIEPIACGNCPYCRSVAKVTGVKSYHILDPFKEDEEY